MNPKIELGTGNTCSRLSVIVPCYNHAEFLELAISGILSQTLLPGEIIILDDASKDSSWEIIEKYAEQFPSLIRAVRNPMNLGAIGNMKKGFELSIGELVYLHSADDFIFPDCFQTYVSLLDRYPAAGMAVSRVAVFRDAPMDYQWESWRWEPEAGYYDPETAATEVMTRSFSTGQVMYRRESILDAGGFIGELEGFMDWFWLHRTLFKRGMAYTPKTICLFRLTGSESLGATSVLNRDKNRAICKKLLEVLQHENNRDVLPFFARSGILHHLGNGMADYVLSHQEYWTPQIFALVHANLHSWNEQAKRCRRVEFRAFSTEKNEITFEDRISEINQKLKDSTLSKIAIYGAGTHTEKVLGLLDDDIVKNRIVTIVVSNTPDEATFCDLPVKSIETITVDEIDGILLSSHSYENEMKKTAKECFPDLPIFTIYSR
jgi:glycosyltransferase involved in cell wall biosynthesis/uncharacterized protein YqfB (UPF0267 family)